MTIVNNLDLAFFYYGLAYILMAAVCVPLRRDDTQNLSWGYFGLFGLLLGSVAWMNLIAISFSDNAFQFYLRMILMSAAFVCLIEFGRRGIPVLNKRWGIWIYIPLLLFAASGLLGDEETLKITPRYALGFVGGIFAAIALFKASQTSQRGKYFLLACSLVMLLESIFSGLIGSTASFFPASIINQENFLKLTGLPIPGVRSALALLITIILAFYYTSIHSSSLHQSSRKKVAPFGAWLIVSLAILLSIGWFVTRIVGHRIEKYLIEDCEENARYTTAALEPEDIAAILESDSANSILSTKLIYRQFSTLHQVDKNILGLHILAKDTASSSTYDRDTLIADIHRPFKYGDELVRLE